MAIETSYMKIGKGPSGLIGVTTNEKALKVWAKGHHLCGEVLSELESVRERNENIRDKHKEEYAGRMKSDKRDREQIQKTLKKCIYPLMIENHENYK